VTRIDNVISKLFLTNHFIAPGQCDLAGARVGVMLVRSYLTLNEKHKAIAAIGSARQALTADPNKLE
jgi:hypothetical protein